MQLLQRVWKENFHLDGTGQVQQLEAQPTGAVANPHDPEAQWAAKGHGKHKKEHVGYKVQVAETVQEGSLEKGEPTPNFITAMVTQPATASDDAGLPLVEEEQEKMGLDKATHLYVDGAYVSAERLAEAQAQGREFIGPAQSPPHKEGRFSVEDFQINVEERKAICPAGKENTQCSRLDEEGRQQVNYRSSGVLIVMNARCANSAWAKASATAQFWWASITLICRRAAKSSKPKSSKPKPKHAMPSKARKVNWCGRMACGERVTADCSKCDCRTI